jgi:two-component system, cell cycle sensor histidine kinase and response regulator CckA
MNANVNPRIIRWINWIPRIAGVMTVGIGVVVIIGWVFDNPILTSVHPALIPMKANAAFAFVFAGMSLLLVSDRTKRLNALARLLAGLVCVIGLVTIAEYAFGWDAGIDQLIFIDSKLPAGTFYPGRMVLNSAFGFLLIGASLLTIERRTRWGDWFTQSSVLIVVITGLLGLLAYVYGLSEFSGYGTAARMALHTSIAFILLAIGILCLQHDVGLVRVFASTGPGSFVARRMMPAAIVVPVLLAWLVGLGENLWYGSQFSDVISATGEIIILVLLVWMIGRSLNKADEQRKITESALGESEERYRSLVENMSEGVGIVDEAERFRLVNPAAESIFGVTAGGLTGRSLQEFVDPDEFAKILKQTGMRRRGETSSYRFPITRPDRMKRDVHATVGPFYDKDGNFIGALGIFRDITDQKNAEAEMVTLRKAIETSGEAIFLTDRHGIITYINPGFTSTYGYTAAEVVGRVTPRILKGGKFSEDNYAMFWKTLLDGQEVRGELRNRRKDGTSIEIEGSANAIFDAENAIIGFIGIQRDITERKQAQEALKSSLALLETTLESTDNGILVVGREGNVLKVNGRFAEMWDIPGEIVSKGSDDQLLNHILGQLSEPEEFLSKVKKLYGDPASESFDLVNFKDGRVFERVSKPMLVGGEPRGRAWSFRDVTQRVVTEQLVRDMQRMESIGILSSGIAHDFNNLLGIIMGNVSLVRSHFPDEHPALNNIQKALSAMGRAAELTKQMLAYSGKGKFQIKLIDVAAMIREQVNLSTSAKPKAAQLSAHLPPTPVYVNGDPAQVHQIIKNLITNSEEAIAETHGVVSITLSAVVMGNEELAQFGRLTNSTMTEGSYALLEVRDNGIGMKRETISKIFDPFFTTKFTGRGLGLSAVLGIIRGHDGGITVESEEGQGTIISVILPAAPSPLISEEPEKKFEIEEKKQQRRIVLVIDDEPDVATMAKEILETGKFSSLVELNPIQAIERYRQRQSEIGAVLLDLMMPEMSGREVVDALQAINPGIKIIISSGYSEEDVAKKIGSSKVSGFIQKPYRMQSLLTLMQSVMAD